jgi:hypothetical protein
MRIRLAYALAAALAVGVPLGYAFVPRDAQAAVSIAYTLDELVMRSPRVVVATGLERKSQWEELGGSKRIVTYTRMRVHDDVYGSGDGEVWVRTLGGVVDNIGQQVSGEASLAVGEKAVVFLTRVSDGAWVVSGMAQGHYPVRAAARKDGEPPPPELLHFSPDVGEILPRRGPSIPAHSQLVGKTVPQSLAAIRAAKADVDARQKH